MIIVLYIGLVIFVVGGLGLLITSFKTSLWWGLACLLINPVSIIYVIVHWSDAKNPFMLQMAGLGIMMVGAVLSGSI